MEESDPRALGSKPSYETNIVTRNAERLTRIERALPTWKDGTLPLSYNRVERLTGIGPALQPWQSWVPPQHFSRT